MLRQWRRAHIQLNKSLPQKHPLPHLEANMAEDFLGQYGPDSKPGAGRASCGGVRPGEEKPLRYDPPKGPTEQMRQRPGLGGTILPCGTQGKR
jgi:hypothetical protein